jgi:hypothetical protein
VHAHLFPGSIDGHLVEVLQTARVDLVGREQRVSDVQAVVLEPKPCQSFVAALCTRQLHHVLACSTWHLRTPIPERPCKLHVLHSNANALYRHAYVGSGFPCCDTVLLVGTCINMSTR